MREPIVVPLVLTVGFGAGADEVSSAGFCFCEFCNCCVWDGDTADNGDVVVVVVEDEIVFTLMMTSTNGGCVAVATPKPNHPAAQLITFDCYRNILTPFLPGSTNKA
jgi:hypothetical protein